MKTILGLLLIWAGCWPSGDKCTTAVHISNIRSLNGSILLSIYTDQEGFEKDQPFQVGKFEKTTVVDGEMLVEINLEPGTYGIALLDDENDNRQMEYNLMGLPREGFGFSNLCHTGMNRPKFSSFAFELKDNKEIIRIKVRYL